MNSIMKIILALVVFALVVMPASAWPSSCDKEPLWQHLGYDNSAACLAVCEPLPGPNNKCGGDCCNKQVCVDSTSCPSDCPNGFCNLPVCGDGECTGSETIGSCPEDCDPCYGVQCADGEECQSGTCVPVTCPAILCDPGDTCIDHECVDPCFGKFIDAFYASPTSGVAPLQVTFEVDATPNWNTLGYRRMVYYFDVDGDGNPTPDYTQVNDDDAIHTFNSPGIYVSKVTVEWQQCYGYGWACYFGGGYWNKECGKEAQLGQEPYGSPVTVNLPEGYCDEQIPCGPGYTCTDHQCIEIPGYCDENSDCPTGQLCGEDNQCYGPCADVQCETGEVCVMGNCVPQTCEVDEDCPEGYVCTDSTCQPYVAPEEEQSRGTGRYQNSYWSEVGECDKALLDAEPGPVLPTTGNGNILIQAKSCIPNPGPAGGLLGCTQMDGMKAFWRRKVDSVNDPRCQFLAYFGGCDGEASNGGFPETIRANNPQDVLRVIGCRPENQGDGPIIYFTLSKGDKILMENSTLDDPKATYLDISYDIPAYCGECRVSENLARIWHMEWIAPVDSPIWDTCPVSEEEA